MKMLSPSVRLAVVLAGTLVAAGAAGAAMPRSAGHMPAPAAVWSAGMTLQDVLRTPALIAVDMAGGLESWPIRPHGGNHPRKLSAPLGFRGAQIVADGDVVIAAVPSPPTIVAYNVKTKAQSIMADTFGTPTDMAIGKDTSIYVVNVASPNYNIGWFPPNAPPKQLSCNLIHRATGIAVDNEGDIFVDAFGPKGGAFVVEMPSGPSGPDPSKCAKVPLRNAFSIAGFVIDPKTDDLLTLDNPSQCAGGAEGRLTVYPKPYGRNTAHSKVLGGNCTGGLRLNADSTIVFYGDQTVSGVSSFINSAEYPSGRRLGSYSDQSSTGPGNFTTIPNSLPN
jgi:hypothetical protein